MSLARIALAAVPTLALATTALGMDGPFAILSPDELAARLGGPDLTVLDVRTSVADYQRGHVPGAVFLANDALRAPAMGVPVQYLDPTAMTDLFNRAGVERNDLVVVYADGPDVLGATMVAYGLERIGHTRTAILDGGLDAYRVRHPLAQAYPGSGVGDLSPRLDRSVFATVDDVRAAMQRPGTTILDTRPAADYLGNTTRWIRNGHIPGAVNLDWHAFMMPDDPHAFRPVEEMRRLVTDAGLRPADPVIVYCGTSREATLVHQVLRHVLGFPDVRLYEGSWTEWCAKPELPVERAAPDRGGAVASAQGHALPVAERLEPFECGTVQRIHTFGGIFLASQPARADFEQAAKGGIRTVINQRHPEENDAFDERQVVTGLGMAYFNPAFNGPDELTDRVLDETRRLLRTAERPVLIHCSSANRTGAAWLAYRVLDDGLPWDDALAEAKTVGLRSPAYETIVRDYVQRHETVGALDETTIQAIRTALADERHAAAFYAAAIERFGARRPFTAFVGAENRHGGALIDLLEARGIEVPPDVPGPIELPGTWMDTVRQAIDVEQSNVEMYDELLAVVADPDVRLVLERLRDRSLNEHLPALRRVAGG